MISIAKYNEDISEEELEKINQEIEREILERMECSHDDSDAQIIAETEKRNPYRFSFLLMMTVILVSVVLFNIGQIIYKSVKLLID